jgi:alkane 1-monooxygenase
MRSRYFKYASPLLIYAGAFHAFHSNGWTVWIPLLYAFVFIPVLELFIKPDVKNLSKEEEDLAKNDRIYDFLLYLVVPLQFLALYSFLNVISQQSHSGIDLAGKVAGMGLLCGVFGINVAHELGHRVNRFEQTLAKMLLLTSLYMHFFIEHNKGHHKNVATKEDPSSARLGEMVYAFYLRSVVYSYISAWKIAGREAEKKGRSLFSLNNQMLQFQLIQLVFLLTIFFFFGGYATILFIAAAIMGFLLLETVNYIEHYGLSRRSSGHGKYERALPHHSWNSDHVIGRVMLFELSRHSDHHYLASRKYQVLRHHDDSPQMPTGYPGMMLLSLVPPLWFRIMNEKIRQLEGQRSAQGSSVPV